MPNQVVLGSGYSAAAPSEQQALRTRLGYVGDGTRTGIVCCHSGTARAGTGALATSGISTAFPQIQSWLADCGWPVVTPDLGGDTACNDTGSSRVAEARAWLQASPRSAKPGKVILLGWSEGGGTAMKYALDNPGNVAAMVLLQPLSDLQDIVTNNRGGFAALVNAAYSGGYSDGTYGADHNPKLFASTLAAANIPAWVAYATDDAVVIPSSVAAVVSGLGSTATVGFTSTGGHGDGFLSKHVGADGSVGAVSRWLSDLGL